MLFPRNYGIVLGLILVAGCQPLAPLPMAGQPPLFGAPPVVGADGTVLYGGAPYPMDANAMPPGLVAANPIHVPVGNHDLAWERIVDIVNNYFRVQREQRVQMVGQVITEGRIDTFPQTGATVLEPHRPDSVGRYNRWESTFQTIRRQAVVRVIPDETGYLVGIEVQKELEDLPRPEHATAGAATFRNDGSLPSQRFDEVSPTRFARHWIPLGRDTALEQQILQEISTCMSGQPAAYPPPSQGGVRGG